LEDLGLDERIVLKWILKIQNGRIWTGFISLRIGTIGGRYECGNEEWGKCREFLY